MLATRLFGDGGRRLTRLILFLSLLVAPALAAELPGGFVRLSDVDPTIRQDVRYAGPGNFLGRRVDGYEAAVCILTPPAAAALAKAQKALATQDLSLVVFDCYRPKRAVADFVRWTRQGGPPDARWHPKVKRGDLIAKGYVGVRSAHSRGSTVDLGIAPLQGAPAADPSCGATGGKTLDFGTGFDCFDPASETASRISGDVSKNRRLLVETMTAAGFRNYRREWWHFTLANEPYPRKRFDFPVTAD